VGAALDQALSDLMMESACPGAGEEMMMLRRLMEVGGMNQVPVLVAASA
jgi:hypothetical protein